MKQQSLYKQLVIATCGTHTYNLQTNTETTTSQLDTIRFKQSID
jgi:hypothetical protein